MNDADIQALQALLDALPPPLQPLDVSALDGFLCAVLLQPRTVPPAQWLALVADVEGRRPPAEVNLQALHERVLRRHAELGQAIAQRQWFDPLVFQYDEAASPSDCVLPWVAGFATGMNAFPSISEADNPELIEPLALLYQHIDAEDLEDADALLEVIGNLEPPAELGEAVEQLVRAVLLVADVSRPRSAPQRPPTHRRSR